MFERLSAEIRAYHVFSSVWPQDEWETQLPALRQELSHAASRQALLRSLEHLANSLRDGHLGFTPAGAGEPLQQMQLPFQLANAGSSTHPRFVVTQSPHGSEASPGDLLLTYDGVPSDELLDHFRFELNASAPGARVDQLSRFLQSRSAAQPEELEPVALTLRHGAHVVSAEAAFRPASSTTVATHAVTSCPAPTRAYGAAYELAAAGTAVCMYRGTREPFASHPIVRHVSFVSTPESRSADHERVQAFLAASPGVAGVLLDLRDNGGGMAADYFIPWYAARPHRSPSEWIRLNPNLTDRARLRRALRDEDAVDEYVRRSARGESWWVRPFACGGEGCDDPSGRSGRVTDAPGALLLGPGCRSSCDSFAAIWTRERLGPTLGTPPAAMYTSLRYPLPVQLGDELLGELTIALCGLRWDASEPWLEGRPLPLDAEVPLKGSIARQELELIEAAIAALREWRGPSLGKPVPSLPDRSGSALDVRP